MRACVERYRYAHIYRTFLSSKKNGLSEKKWEGDIVKKYSFH